MTIIHQEFIHEHGIHFNKVGTRLPINLQNIPLEIYKNNLNKY